MRHLSHTDTALRAKKAERCPQCNRRTRRKANRCAFCSFTKADREVFRTAAAERAAAHHIKLAAKKVKRLERLAWLLEDATGRLDARHTEALEEDISLDIGKEAASAG